MENQSLFQCVYAFGFAILSMTDSFVLITNQLVYEDYKVVIYIGRQESEGGRKGP